MLTAGVSSTNIVVLDMGELALDGVGMPLAAFIQQGRCGGAKSMRRHLVFGVSETAECRIERAIGNRPIGCADAGEQRSILAGDLPEPLENGDGLPRQRYA